MSRKISKTGIYFYLWKNFIRIYTYIAETLSNLTSKSLKKVSDGGVEFEHGAKLDAKDLDYKLIQPLIWR